MISSGIPKGENYRHLLNRRIGKLRISKTSYSPGDWNKTHYHENARFVFVLQGKFSERYDRKERFCRPFTGIFRPPMEKHSDVYEDGVICLSVNLAPEWLKRLENSSIKLQNSNAIRNQNLKYLITKVSHEMVYEDDISALAIDSLLTEIAIEMHRKTSQIKDNKPPLWLKTAIEYIHENFSSNLTLVEIATIANVHPAHLSRVFRKTQLFTIADFIRHLRVEKARNLLIFSSLPLAEIAIQVGFADQSHFTKTFKSLTYQTPAQFRKNNRIS